MTVDELYEALDKAGIDFEVVEIFDGLRVISIMVDEVDEEEETTWENQEIDLDGGLSAINE